MSGRSRTAVCAGAVVALAACGGGRDAVAPSLVPVAKTSAPALPRTASAVATLRLTIPATAANAAHRRRPAYVSSATNSLSFGQNGATPQILALAATSPACTSASGARTCVVDVPATPGANQSFTLKAFASTDGSGTPLAVQTLVATIVSGADNPLNVTLDGVVSRIALALANATLRYGHPGTTNLVVSGIDAAGETIVGPGVFADTNGNPISLALASDDASGVTTLGSQTVTQPTTVPVAYTGGARTSVTFTATSSGVATATATLGIVCGTVASTIAIFSPAHFDDANGTLTEGIEVGGNAAPFTLAPPHSFVAVPTGPVAVDARGFTYVEVADAAGNATIEQYCPSAYGTETPYRSIVDATTSGTFALAAGPANELYRADFSRNAIVGYAPDAGTLGSPASGAATPSTTIAGSATQLDAPDGIAIAPDGSIVVANRNDVLVFAKGASGNVAPIRTITNTAAGIVGVRDARVDPAGNVYALYDHDNRSAQPLANPLGPPAIAVFAHGSLATPARVISGPATQLGTNLGQPFGGGGTVRGLAIDPNGNIWVRNGGTDTGGNHQDAVEEFAAGASGNATPIASFAVAADTNDIAVDGSGSVALAMQRDGVLIYRNGTLAAQLQPAPSEATYAVAFDSTGDLIASFEQFNGNARSSALYTYGPAAKTSSVPTRILAAPDATRVEFHLAVETDGTIVGLNSLGVGLPSQVQDVDLYAPTATTQTPTRTFADQFARGIAVDANGTFYSADNQYDGIATYPSGSSGSFVKRGDLYRDARPSTLRATAVTVDAGGTIYVASALRSNVSVYPTGADGVPPRSILGPATTLEQNIAFGQPIESLAIDGDGNLVALVTAQFDTIATFARGASGDVAPIASTQRFGVAQLGDRMATGPGPNP